MKKIIIVILITLLTLQMRGQNNKNLIPNPTKTNPYYMCVNTAETPAQTHRAQMILKITHPQWAIETDTLSIPYLSEGESITDAIDVRLAAKKWHINRIPKCISVDFTNCLRLGYVDESSKRKVFTFKKDVSHIVEIEKQSRPASLSFIVADSVSFESMQKVELEKSSFTYFKDTIERVVYIVPGSGHSFYWDKDKPDCADPYKARTVREVQQKLNEKGYDCPVDNVMGMKTKDALVQFQKDNALAVGVPWEILNELFPPPPPNEDDLKLKSLNEW